MNNKVLLLLISFGFWISIIGLITVLSFFNQPSLNDDYCFGWIGRDYGVFKGAFMYYTNWSGRYSSNVLMHLLPLTFSSNYNLFFVGPLSLILIGFFNGVFFLKNLLKTQLRSFWLWVLAFTFQATCLYIIPVEGLFETIFWFPASIYYLSLQLFLLFVNIYFFTSKFKGKIVFEGLLIFILVGSSEFTMIIFSSLFFLHCFWELIAKKINFSLLILIGIWLGSIALEILAPGNFIRLGNEENNWVQIFWTANGYLYDLILFLVSQVYFWVWVLFLILISYKIQIPKFALNKWQIFCIIFFFFAGLWLSLFAVSMGLMQDYIPKRNFSLLIWYLLAFSTFISLVLKTFLGEKLPITKFNLVLPAILFIVFLPLNNNFKTLYREWKYDKLKKYSFENVQRFESLKSSAASIIELEPIKNKETLFFKDDLSTDSTHLWCKCVAHYYHKKAVYLKK